MDLPVRRQIEDVLIVHDDARWCRAVASAATDRGVRARRTSAAGLASAMRERAVDGVLFDSRAMATGDWLTPLQTVAAATPAPVVVAWGDDLATVLHGYHVGRLGVRRLMPERPSPEDAVATIFGAAAEAPRVEPLLRAMVGHTALPDVLGMVSDLLLQQALAVHRGNRRAAANMLGTHRESIQKMVRAPIRGRRRSSREPSRPAVRDVLIVSSDARWRERVTATLAERDARGHIASSSTEVGDALGAAAFDVALVDGRSLDPGAHVEVTETLASARSTPITVTWGPRLTADDGFRMSQLGVRRMLASRPAAEQIWPAVEAAVAERPVIEPHVRGVAGHERLSKLVDRSRDILLDQALGFARDHRTNAAELLGVSRQAVVSALQKRRWAEELARKYAP